ncbi:MAG: hypothetical protein CVT66_06360 [Actinobacteria bacterium HGW-Actinobacteria-6]|nr:MAG: hypothetical protein CVT66_06360 [Actinobacteria bacterium HGW-Actinobacteria-6]
MTDLYTKSGRLLQRVDNHLFSRAGRYLGRVVNQKVFDPDGRYCGTLVGDRVVYRTIDSAAIVAASLEVAHTATARANIKGSPIWGIEPPFGD